MGDGWLIDLVRMDGGVDNLWGEEVGSLIRHYLGRNKDWDSTIDDDYFDNDFEYNFWEYDDGERV